MKENLLEKIDRLAVEEKALYARVEPLFETGLEALVTTPAGGRFTPQHTLVLDLTKSPEQLLAEMKPKGRYNIGLAARRGVSCAVFKTFEQIPAADWQGFYNLLEETGNRDGFGVHSRGIYESLLKTLGAGGAGRLVLAYEPHMKEGSGRVLAGLIEVLHDETAIYYYGASSSHLRNLMAPYAVQWTAIEEARAAGMKHYDFLGIAPADEPTHAWRGVTDFKEKFGGTAVSYAGAFEIVYRPLEYKLLRFIKPHR